MLVGGVLGLAVLGALLTGSPGGGPGGVLAQPMADHVHVVHRGISPAALPRPLQPLVFPPRRRVHILDPRTALNLVQAHESRRRRGSKRPPPYHRGPPRGPPRPPRWSKGPPKRRGHGGARDKPYAQQATRGSSPAATRVRYRGSKKSKKAKSAKKSRPQLPVYADGYAEDDDDLRLQADEPEPEEDRPVRKKVKSSSKQQQQQSTYPKGWGPDGGYRVPAPPAAPQYPPYGTDEDEPGTGHLDLEERFINQHNQFYRHGYPGDSGESAPASTQSKRHKPGLGQGLYEDEEIELAEASDGDFGDGVLNAASSTRTAYGRRPSKTRYSLHDGQLHDDDSCEYLQQRPSGRPSSYSKGRKKHTQGDSKQQRHQSMYHAKFREPQDDRTLSAANFNYELSGAASETAHTSVNKGGNHRPVHEDQVGVTDVRTADTNFFRTRKPQYWG